ncbi:hypothetical protein P691DRAFT_779020 [Macrolepiota fuliginosa MF-IS2]|uniref:Nephrocystin 3-like N-terminal domain-containing protein n=1 Tax=Macrolepiota fuliginosa MF-IS2 TaxID=1400762 RepID=A0A9P5X235_9AGAR|nr:hypothetical protein P691DRAFT_779020 [Macrolepiota fuliginosa MF-IS2]
MAGSHTLQNVHDFVMNNPQFVHISEPEKRGLEILLEASIPEAAYDSSDHPSHCHPGTRYQYIDRIVHWGMGDVNPRHRIFWLKGPAGVGKSAIAQSCAEELAARKKLAAAFFFSRPNLRDNPQCLFTSISYQLASKLKSYSEILKSTIHDDPTIVTKALLHQFHDLFISPLQELAAKGEKVTERVVIIDGLDEVAGETAQQAIIEIIAASTRDGTTPFVWLLCSRLEPHLIATFNSPALSVVTHQEELMVSRDIDNEIAKYLTDELAKLGKEHDLPLPWPRERDIGALINLSGGLFIYATTVIRFIGDRNSLGPKDQLRAVLALATSVSKHNSGHPLSELDLFYLLILQRIPAKILQTVQRVLLATTIGELRTNLEGNRRLLRLSSSQFHAACRTLHSVMKVESSKINFYHASFMDFMRDPQRSKQFCIQLESGNALRTELMTRLQAICDDPDVKPYSESFNALTGAHNNSKFQQTAYKNLVEGFLVLCSTLPLDATTLAALASFNFNKIAKSMFTDYLSGLNMDALVQNILEKDRTRIVRSCKHRDRHIYEWEVTQVPEGANWEGSYILGRGQNKCFCWRYQYGITLTPYPERPATEKIHRTLMKRIKFWRT